MPHVTPLRAADPRRVGRYRLAGRIAGMRAAGPAYLARTVDGGEVTVTLLDGDWATDSAARDRFTAEAAAAQRVAPFCAARILDSGVDGDHEFLVSEYVAGPSLLEVVSAEGGRRGADLDALAIGAATGIAAIHQAGLVHGDFGPEHLILSDAGPRVVGFGVTPPYGAATPAADMLGWAQTMVFAATGSPPSSPADLQVLPMPLRRVAASCLSADPAARPAARSAVLDLLGDDDPAAGVLAEGSRRARRAAVRSAASPGTSRRGAQQQRQPGQRRQRPARRRFVSAGLWAACAAVLVVIVGVLSYDILGSGPHGALGPASAGRPASHRGASGAGSGPRSAGSARSPSPNPSQQASPSPPAIPPTLAGSWAGQATQSSPADVFSVRVQLSAGGRSGTISYAGTAFACSGALSVVAATQSMLTMQQGIVSGQQTCANGVVTLRQGEFGTLLFRFRGQPGPTAHGTLAKA
jgi:hypothetical protein